MKAADRNLELLRVVATHLGPLRDRVVFVGGAAAGLLITDPGAAMPRPTKDVDIIVEVASLAEYNTALRDQLLDLGFTEDSEEGAPLCRWVVAGVKVDIMPTAEGILGFSNRWYAPAIEHAVEHQLPGGPTIRLATAPFFIATKLEAFHGRGQDDYQASHDLEDLVAVVNGRPELDAELAAAPLGLRQYLAEAFGRLLDTAAFQDALPGHLSGDAASQARLPALLKRLGGLAGRV